MPGKTKRSTSEDVYYKSYRATDKSKKNKEKRLLKHMLKHPNDKQAETGSIPEYTRKKPLSYWETLIKAASDKKSKQATKRV